MFPLRLHHLLLGLGLAVVPLCAQTQVDLRTQSKSVDFQGASMTRPIRTSATLPATCSVNEVLLLTTAAAGSNIYVCLTANNWVPQAGGSGAVTIQNGGTSVGARATQNFAPGTGLITSITDTGTKLNIQQTVDTAMVVSKAALQSGSALLCRSASASASAYTCALTPTLTGYTSGMVLNWRPDVTGIGGATTLNVDQLGAVSVVKADGVSAPGSADIITGQLYLLWYDGTAFRLLSTSGSSGSSGSSTPATITATGAGGPTAVTATAEWHSSLAYCSAVATSTLTWNVPPAAATAATADGCAGTNVADAYAAFTTTGTPSLQTSFLLPKTLTGKADVTLTYLTPTAGGTFTPALDVVCTAVDGSVANDPVFIGNNFFAPGPTVAPSTASQIASVSATGISWPSGCNAGTRAHLRLIRTDTTGSAAKLDVAEIVIVLRRTL